jgi:hypothetical protein
MLSRLDTFEGHPKIYTRREVSIMMNGKVEKMWGYLMRDFREHLLQKPAIPTFDAVLAEYLGVKGRRPENDEEWRQFKSEIKEHF